MDVKCSTPSFLTASIQALGSGDKAALQTFERLCIEVLPPGASGGPVCQHTPALGHDPGADLGPTGDQTSREDEGPFRIHSIPLGSLTCVHIYQRPGCTPHTIFIYQVYTNKVGEK